MRILFIGDIVGRPGVNIVTSTMPALRREQSIDLIIVNGENADGGSGITPSIYRKLVAAGVDAITLGDHIYRKKDIVEVLENRSNIVKPANFPAAAPGKTWALVKTDSGRKAIVFSLLGRVYMRPVDCPFTSAKKLIDEFPDDVKVRVCDFHAEATSDKQVMGRLLDGHVTAVLGTHTHVQTADEQIYPGGTAFICDVGMTGPHESILGRRIDNVTDSTITFRPLPFSVATKDIRINGVLLDVDSKTGRAIKIERVTITEKEANALIDRHEEE